MAIFRHLVIPSLALALAAGPSLADGFSFPGVGSNNKNSGSKDGKTTICHNGNTITVANSSLQAHWDHGDTEGACPEPGFTAVVILRCLNTEAGQILVSGSSGSDNAAVTLPVPQKSCANAVAGMMNAGFRLQQVSTGLLRGETEYLFLGNSDSQ